MSASLINWPYPTQTLFQKLFPKAIPKDGGNTKTNKQTAMTTTKKLFNALLLGEIRRLEVEDLGLVTEPVSSKESGPNKPLKFIEPLFFFNMKWIKKKQYLVDFIVFMRIK